MLKPLTHDDLEFYRKFSLNTLESCLERKPELEDVILGIIINKLGDTSKKVQCHAIYLLLKLSQTHIEMTQVIVHEVNLFMQRNGAKSTHVFYAVAYLNRVASMVAPKDERVRAMLLRIYFSLFKKILKTEEKPEEEEAAKALPFKKDRNKSKVDNVKAAKMLIKKKATKHDEGLEQEDNKVAELVLKGVNILMSKCSAQLFDSEGGESSSAEMRRLIEEETASIFRLAHHDVFKIQIQALKLLFQFAR